MKKSHHARLPSMVSLQGLYAAVTILTASFAYGNIQFRIAEALCPLVALEPSLTIGLTLGCLIANLFSTVSALDIIVGTAATLLACLLTRFIKKRGRCRCRRSSAICSWSARCSRHFDALREFWKDLRYSARRLAREAAVVYTSSAFRSISSFAKRSSSTSFLARG